MEGGRVDERWTTKTKTHTHTQREAFAALLGLWLVGLRSRIPTRAKAARTQPGADTTTMKITSNTNTSNNTNTLRCTLPCGRLVTPLSGAGHAWLACSIGRPARMAPVPCALLRDGNSGV